MWVLLSISDIYSARPRMRYMHKFPSSYYAHANTSRTHRSWHHKYTTIQMYAYTTYYKHTHTHKSCAFAWVVFFCSGTITRKLEKLCALNSESLSSSARGTTTRQTLGARAWLSTQSRGHYGSVERATPRMRTTHSHGARARRGCYGVWRAHCVCARNFLMYIPS